MSYLVLFEELNKDLSQIMLLTKLYPHHALFSHPGKLNGNEVPDCQIVPNLNLITMTIESLSDPFTVDQLNMTASTEPKLKRSRVNSIGQEKPNKRVAVDSSGHSTVEEVNPKIQRSYLICDPTVTEEGPVYPKDSFGWFVEKKLYDSTPTPDFYGRIHGLN
ncbi:hypothetical protein HDV02_004592 [Globomyces sp. JEL0801]|nr:hypothetical protein HDV02_004592 [Globomyces sp. JEL0801]